MIGDKCAISFCWDKQLSELLCNNRKVVGRKKVKAVFQMWIEWKNCINDTLVPSLVSTRSQHWNQYLCGVCPLLLETTLAYIYNALYLHFCPSPDSKTEPRCTFSLNKQTCDLNPLINEHAIVSILSWQTPAQNRSSLPCQKWVSYNASVF